MITDDSHDYPLSFDEFLSNTVTETEYDLLKHMLGTARLKHYAVVQSLYELSDQLDSEMPFRERYDAVTLEEYGSPANVMARTISNAMFRLNRTADEHEEARHDLYDLINY
jgi:hypothetical protein